MGWTSCYDWYTKERVINDILLASVWENEEKQICESKVLNHSLRNGNHLWVEKQRLVNGEVQDHYIMLYLLSGAHAKKDGWAYKDMSESCGPFYYDCPKAFLKRVPVVNEEWRQQCNDYRKK